MANPVTLAGTMPQTETNGLFRIATDLMSEEGKTKLRLVVGIISTVKVTEKVATGEEYPTVAFHHIEVVHPEDVEEVSKALGHALAVRTGAAQLPFPEGEMAPGDRFPELDPPEE